MCVEALLADAMPEHVQVLSSELDGEVQASVLQVHLHTGVAEGLLWRGFRDGELAVLESQPFNVFGMKSDLVTDVNFVSAGIELQLSDVGSLVVGILDNETNGAEPGDLFAMGVR